MAAIGKAKKRKYIRRMGVESKERKVLKPLKKMKPSQEEKPKRKYTKRKAPIANFPDKPKRKYVKKNKTNIPKDVLIKHIKKTKFYKEYMKLMSANGKAMKFMVALNDLNLAFISEFKGGE